MTWLPRWTTRNSNSYNNNINTLISIRRSCLRDPSRNPTPAWPLAVPILIINNPHVYDHRQ